MIKMSLGLRVLRGPDWEQRDIDGGEGHLGTLVGVKAEEGTAEVVWDNGQVTTCRVGKEGKHDLRILDNAQAGVSHPGIQCHSCHKTVLGIRWNCAFCISLDLCTLCYVTEEHALSHEFDRYLEKGAQGVRVRSRKNCERIELAGIFLGARVTRGRDWESGDVDGGPGGVGTVVEVMSPESGSARNAVRVSWDSGQSLQHRLGLHGKVDLVLSKKSPVAPRIYLSHLPPMVVDGPNASSGATGICIGAHVVVETVEETFKTIQKGRSGWCIGMAKCIGEVGLVKVFTESGDCEVDFGEHKWRVNPVALTMIGNSPIVVGDKVRILEDAVKVKKLQNNHGGWNGKMMECLGKVGRVVRVNDFGNYKVSFGKLQWTLNPLCCRPAPDGVIENEPATASALPTATGESDQVAGQTPEVDEPLSPNGKKFFNAIKCGDVSKVSNMLDTSPEVLQQAARGSPPLHSAAEAGEVGVATLLLDRGADINGRDREGNTALILAVARNHTDLARMLLERGAEVSVANGKERTALHKAAFRRQLDTCRLLLDRRANVNMRDTNGHTPLLVAMENVDADDVIDVLLTSPEIDFDTRSKRGYNVFHFAVKKGRPRCLTKLLARERSLVNSTTGVEEMTVVHMAVNYDHVDLILMLVQAGADVNKADRHNVTPLHQASRKLNIDAIMALVQAGADLHLLDLNTYTPLHCVLDVRVSKGGSEDARLQAANYLIQHGASTDIRSRWGHTPLEKATPTLRARVEAFMAENGPITRRPVPVHQNQPSNPPSSPVQSNQTRVRGLSDGEPSTADRNSDAGANAVTEQQPVQHIPAAPKCKQCSIADATVIFLPCAHKVMCQGCVTSVSVCCQCHVQIKRKVDIRGNIIPG